MSIHRTCGRDCQFSPCSSSSSPSPFFLASLVGYYPNKPESEQIPTTRSTQVQESLLICADTSEGNDCLDHDSLASLRLLTPMYSAHKQTHPKAQIQWSRTKVRPTLLLLVAQVSHLETPIRPHRYVSPDRKKELTAALYHKVGTSALKMLHLLNIGQSVPSATRTA